MASASLDQFDALLSELARFIEQVSDIICPLPSSPLNLRIIVAGPALSEAGRRTGGHVSQTLILIGQPCAQIAAFVGRDTTPLPTLSCSNRRPVLLSRVSRTRIYPPPRSYIPHHAAAEWYSTGASGAVNRLLLQTASLVYGWTTNTQTRAENHTQYNAVLFLYGQYSRCTIISQLPSSSTVIYIVLFYRPVAHAWQCNLSFLSSPVIRLKGTIYTITILSHCILLKLKYQRLTCINSTWYSGFV